MFLYANFLFAHIKDFNFFFLKKVLLIFKMWIVYSIMTNRGFAFSRYFKEKAHLVHLIRREDLLLFSCHLGLPFMYRAIPLRKCSIKALYKWRSSVYILIEICHQWNKWLDPKLRSMPQKYIYFYLHNKLNFVPQLCNTTYINNNKKFWSTYVVYLCIIA